MGVLCCAGRELPVDAMTRSTVLIAHRGWSNRFPENSVPSIAAAIPSLEQLVEIVDLVDQRHRTHSPLARKRLAPAELVKDVVHRPVDRQHIIGDVHVAVIVDPFRPDGVAMLIEGSVYFHGGGV